MKKSRLLGAVCAYSCTLATLLLVSTAVSATVWAPTNEDTDFIQFDLGNSGISTNGGTLLCLMIPILFSAMHWSSVRMAVRWSLPIITMAHGMLKYLM